MGAAALSLTELSEDLRERRGLDDPRESHFNSHTINLQDEQEVPEVRSILASENRNYLDPTKPEVIRVFQLGLDWLTPGQYAGIGNSDKQRLAVVAHDLLVRLRSRATTLGLDGNFEHPSFLDYGFASQEEATQYAQKLGAMHKELIVRPVVSALENKYRQVESSPRGKIKTRDLLTQNRRLVVARKPDSNVVMFDVLKDKHLFRSKDPATRDPNI